MVAWVAEGAKKCSACSSRCKRSRLGKVRQLRAVAHVQVWEVIWVEEGSEEDWERLLEEMQVQWARMKILQT